MMDGGIIKQWQPGESTETLNVYISKLADEYKEGGKFRENPQFNVAVVFEAIPINGSW